MSSMLSSQGMALATAMAAVSGTVILLSLCIQKQPSLHRISPPSLRSCISSEPKKNQKKNQKKKRVQFAESVVDPVGDGEEFRKKHELEKVDRSCGGKRKMPENRVALYNGILRDRVVHRSAYSC